MGRRSCLRDFFDFVLSICLSNGDFLKKLGSWVVFVEEGGLWEWDSLNWVRRKRMEKMLLKLTKNSFFSHIFFQNAAKSVEYPRIWSYISLFCEFLSIGLRCCFFSVLFRPELLGCAFFQNAMCNIFTCYCKSYITFKWCWITW